MLLLLLARRQSAAEKRIKTAAPASTPAIRTLLHVAPTATAAVDKDASARCLCTSSGCLLLAHLMAATHTAYVAAQQQHGQPWSAQRDQQATLQVNTINRTRSKPPATIAPANAKHRQHCDAEASGDNSIP
jgi:hypothetical protein